MPKVAVLPGDGIGIDVTREAVKVLECLDERLSLDLSIHHFDHGAQKYLDTGVTLPDEDLEVIASHDAIYLGALGDPRIPDMRHGRDILLGMRFKLDLYVNHRPVRLLHPDLCPLKDRGPDDIDMVFFRENTEGAYVGAGGIFKKGTPDEVAIQEDINTRKGVERIIRHAFEYAKANGRKRVCMADKSNALRFGHDIWKRVFDEVSGEYPDIEPSHYFVDALCMQLVLEPQEFDVVVSCNMFGDILTDLAAALQGGLGVASSGNVHPGGNALFEPVHGSAPPLAGKDQANPFAAMITAQMMLDHLGLSEAANLIEKAIRNALLEGKTTADLGGSLGTAACGDDIVSRIRAETAG
ncbi:MAG: 3-isopropylmalate dehydrogenase [Acidobacteriota bacterium]